MKSRLEVAPLTAEDVLIWNQLWRDQSPRMQNAMIWLNPMCDRRDAELMLTLTLAKGGLRRLKATSQAMYDGLTAREQDVMRRLWGTRRP